MDFFCDDICLNNRLDFSQICNPPTVLFLKNKLELTRARTLLDVEKSCIFVEMDHLKRQLRQNELEMELIKLKLDDFNI